MDTIKKMMIVDDEALVLNLLRRCFESKAQYDVYGANNGEQALEITDNLIRSGAIDIIVIDFPAPKNVTLSRLFSAEFYWQVLKLLKRVYGQKDKGPVIETSLNLKEETLESLALGTSER